MTISATPLSPLPSLFADEGMWLFNNPPRKHLQDKYHFEPTDAWLAHLQHSAVRFNDGGSGSFISADGLVLTNHHVGASALQKLSSADHNYLNTGFHAKSRAEEIRAVDSELNVLQNIEDVTGRVEAAVKPGMNPAAAHEARQAAINTIQKESFDATGLRSDVVTLYHGAVYQLYRYKRYTDVRLVFAPEQSIAFFGGDPDNFEYPRYDLDFCLFRVYENGAPAKIKDYLHWSTAGIRDDELVFVAGHPGHTDRMDTVANLDYIRDTELPQTLARLFRKEVLLSAFSQRSRENARRAEHELFGVQNSRKARGGMLAGLQNPEIMAQKKREEQTLLAAAKADPKLKDDLAAWHEIERSLGVLKQIKTELDMLEYGWAFDSRLFNIARTLVRLPVEDAKPNAERLPEFGESSRPSLEQQLFSTAPIYDDLETLKLADSLSMLVEKMGADNELVVKILAGKSPRDRAAELVHGTKLRSVEDRKRLAAGDTAAIKACDDPMIRLALLVDPASRAVRKRDEAEVQEPMRQAYAKIAAVRFSLYGTNTYPDATFTLRLAFGRVKGYTEAGRMLPAWTTIAGAFEHSAEHQNREPFRLPESWATHKEQLDLATPMNFVSTADIIGGNSGSPVVNRDGQLVGLIFDGNIQSLVLDFIYTSVQARAVSVDARAILASLRKVYDAGDLADEIERGSDDTNSRSR
ncbi:MAG TPA: S46 family peptidase [Pirellulales bacterium]|nr:S46 family peptidase [Pirellulales bacterium]